MRFTPEQLSAIEADNPELLISAAAGSGKTSVLVERILRLVSVKGLSIDRMLVVTFTRAAAAELRERLELRLADAAENDPRMLAQSELVANAQISTIHGYCQRVVHERFEHCGIDPQFSICEAATRERLFNACLEEALDEAYELAKTDDDLRELTGKLTDRELQEALPPLYDFLLSRPDPMEWLERNASADWSEDAICASPAADAIIKEASLRLDGAVALNADALARADEPDFPAPYAATLAADRQVLLSLVTEAQRGLKELINALSSLRFPTLARFKPSTDAEAAFADYIKDVRAEYKALATDLKKLLPESLSSASADLAFMRGASIGMYKLVRAFHERFTSEKRERSVVDFTDLEHMTLSVLSDERLRAIESERFDAIFVDEYQDVSAIQEAILNGLRREGGAPQYYFYVGDVKQSIYRFRLAEPTLFLRKQREFSTDADAPRRLITLNRNFRSRPEVLAAVNRVFEHVMDSRVTEIDYDEDARLIAGGGAARSTEAVSGAELHMLDTDGVAAPQRVVAEATLIARDILARIGSPITDASGEVCGALRYRDIAILSPVSRGVADKVELTLRAAGIPVYCESSSDSMTSAEVRQVVAHLKLLDNMMDDVALISELRSPLFDMTESELCRIRLLKPQREASFLEALRFAASADNGDEALRERCRGAMDMLARERELLSSMPLDEYLWDFMQRSGLYAHYGAQPGGRQRLANLRLLCSLAEQHESGRGDGLHGFLGTLSEDVTVNSGLSPTVVNPWEDVVRLMTIHKSKGLEFPLVYVMGLGRSLRGRSAGGRLSYHQTVGFSMQYVNERARTRRATLIASAIELARRAEERAERARLLYVAMTRAKWGLVLVGSARNEAFGYEDALAMKRGELRAEGPYSVRSAGSMLEWVEQCVKPWDEIEERDRSASPVSVRRDYTHWDDLSTAFPRFDVVFRVVFHIAPEISRLSQKRGKVNMDFPLIPSQIPEGQGAQQKIRAGDASLREPDYGEHMPLKLGVTALCRMLGESGVSADAAMEGDDAETADMKRLPLQAERPRLLSAMPSAPAFLRPEGDAKPLLRGTATHKLLGLLSLDGARACGGDYGAMLAFAMSERDRLTQRGIMTEEEAKAADAGLAARFLCDPLGVRMLKSGTVRREWRFNLLIGEPTVAQGVIDLCFIEEGGWVLADFKTDRVNDVSELYARYERQLMIYRDALTRLTPYPVRESILYSLTLGRSVSKRA